MPLCAVAEPAKRVLVVRAYRPLPPRANPSPPSHDLLLDIPPLDTAGPQVGGGDGGVVREVARHADVQSVECVDIDKMVPEMSRKFFPELAVGFEARDHTPSDKQWRSPHARLHKHQ